MCGIILSTTANSPDDELSLSDLEQQFVAPEFIVYVGITILLLISTFAELKAILLLPRKDNAERYRRIPFLYATAAGIFGSFSVLLAKCASELLWLTFQGRNQFIYLTTYLFVGGMIATLVLQTDLLNRSIMSGDTLSVFPVFQCFWIGVRMQILSKCNYSPCHSVVLLVELCFIRNLPDLLSMNGSHCLWRYFVRRSTVVGHVSQLICVVGIILGIYLLAKHEDKVARVTRPLIDPHPVRYHYGTLVPASPAASASSFVSEINDDIS